MKCPKYFKETHLSTSWKRKISSFIYKGKVIEVTQTQFSPRMRIEKIELHNFKGVVNGTIEFNCLKTPTEKDTCSDILGVYGQNGSGKTTLLEALHIAKLAMMGVKIPFRKYRYIISKGADFARMAVTIQVSNEDGSLYHLEYAFSLGVWEFSSSAVECNNKKAEKVPGGVITSSAVSAGVLATALGFVGNVPSPYAAIAGAAGIVVSQMLNSSSRRKEVSRDDGKVEQFVIFDEVVSLSGMFHGSNIRFGPVFDTRTTETVFLPRAKQKSYFPNDTASALKELQKYKDDALVNSSSFIFCDDLSRLLLKQGQLSEYAQIIMDLKAFAIQKIRVLNSKYPGTTGNDTIPLYTANRGVRIKRTNSTTFLDDEGLQTLRAAITGLNVVLQQVIPGLTLKAVRQVDDDINDRNKQTHVPGTKVTVYSVRDGVRIPLAEESAGIIRLISSIGLISYAFVNHDVTVAIDEIDAGVYEYLRGELLLIFEEYGSGQLIFTCHNLRPMEVLNKKYIYFTTTNPENRYLKPKSIRNENNLRDVYLREIIQGGQDEDLYSAAKHGKIASALQKAGEIIGQE